MSRVFTQKDARAVLAKFKAAQAQKPPEASIAASLPKEVLEAIAPVRKSVPLLETILVGRGPIGIVSVDEHTYNLGGPVLNADDESSWVLIDNDGVRYDVERSGRVRLAQTHSQVRQLATASIPGGKMTGFAPTRLAQAVMQQISLPDKDGFALENMGNGKYRVDDRVVDNRKSIRQCAHCDKIEAEERLIQPKFTLLRCGRCNSAYYCDQTCQRAHWSKHRAACSIDQTIRSSNGTEKETREPSEEAAQLHIKAQDKKMTLKTKTSDPTLSEALQQLKEKRTSGLTVEKALQLLKVAQERLQNMRSEKKASKVTTKEVDQLIKNMTAVQELAQNMRSTRSRDFDLDAFFSHTSCELPLIVPDIIPVPCSRTSLSDFYGKLRLRSPEVLVSKTTYIDGVVHQTSEIEAGEYASVLFSPGSWVCRLVGQIPSLLGWTMPKTNQVEEAPSSLRKRFLYLPFLRLSDVQLCSTLPSGADVPKVVLTEADMLTAVKDVPEMVLRYLHTFDDAFCVAAVIHERCADGKSLLACEVCRLAHPMFTQAESCGSCKKPQASVWCPNCQRALYCSEQCIEANFAKHKKDCAQWQTWNWAKCSTF